MSDPIDFIDLTEDSPKDKPLRLRNINVENICNNGTTKSQKCKSSKRRDSVIEISVESTHRDVKTMEIIDLDNVNPSEQSKGCLINDSDSGNAVMLICPICYEQLSSKLKPMSTRCGHIFCAQCLEQSLRTFKKCPTCKKGVKFQSCTRLYF